MSFRRLILPILLITLLIPKPSDAAENLVFRDVAEGAREQSVIDYLANRNTGFQANIPFGIAAYDLNRDGVTEWFVTQKDTPSCQAEANCPFYIVGLSRNDLLLLGTIRASKITVDSDRLYGIYKLFVYSNKNDDFDYRLWSWNPEQYSFQPLM